MIRLSLEAQSLTKIFLYLGLGAYLSVLIRWTLLVIEGRKLGHSWIDIWQQQLKLPIFAHLITLLIFSLLIIFIKIIGYGLRCKTHRSPQTYLRLTDKIVISMAVVGSFLVAKNALLPQNNVSLSSIFLELLSYFLLAISLGYFLVRFLLHTKSHKDLK